MRSSVWTAWEQCVQSLPEKGRSDASRPAAPLIEALLSHADAAPHKTAFAGPAGEVSFGDLARMIAAAAARIARIVGGRGRRVVLCGPNSPQLAAAYFAVHAAGGVAVPVDADIPDDGLSWIVKDADASLV